MSKNPKPTVEELRCVYDLILRGYDDADILAEYASLYENGNLMFPYRTDKRFVRERRKELAAAEEILKEHVKRQIDPIIVEQRKQHYNELAEIASSFLERNLDQIAYDATDEDQEYDLDTGESLTRKELIARLTDNIFQACDKYERYRVMDWLASHLEPVYLSGKDLFAFIETRPIEFIKIIRTLATRKTFKGKCDVCKDWQ